MRHGVFRLQVYLNLLQRYWCNMACGTSFKTHSSSGSYTSPYTFLSPFFNFLSLDPLRPFKTRHHIHTLLLLFLIPLIWKAKEKENTTTYRKYFQIIRKTFLLHFFQLLSEMKLLVRIVGKTPQLRQYPLNFEKKVKLLKL